MKREQRRLRKECVYDTVAVVVLGSTQITADDRPLLDALEAKYSALVQLLFTHVLRLEHGHSFLKLPEPDRNKLIGKKAAEMDHYVQEGNAEALYKLIDNFPKQIVNLRWSISGQIVTVILRASSLEDTVVNNYTF